jgi:branched-chain amino acid transport system substrate-binding protein
LALTGPPPRGIRAARKPESLATEEEVIVNLRRLNRVFGVAAALLSLSLANPTVGSAQAPAGAPAGKPIKLAYVQTLSGLAMVYTVGGLRAFQLGVDEINAAGGVLGRPIQVVVRDSKGIPSEGLKFARELVINERVDLLAGEISSAVALAISEYARSQKMLFVVDGATSSAITEEKGHDYVVRVGTDTTTDRGRALSRLLKDRPYSKFFTITHDYEYGWRVISDFWDDFVKSRPDAERVGEIKVRLGTPDFTPQISAIMAANPEVVISAIWGSDSVTLIKQAKAAGLFDKIKLFAGPEVVPPDVAVALGKECPEGILSGTLYPFWEMEKKYPRAKEFNVRYYNATGKYPLSGDALGYEHIHWIADGIKKAGTLEPIKVGQAMRGMTKDSVVGRVTLRPIDGQVLYPYFWGYTKFVPEYPFAILADLKTFPPETIYSTVEEIKAKREGR